MANCESAMKIPVARDRKLNVNNISTVTQMGISLLLPSEQKKIAKILSVLDMKIEKEENLGKRVYRFALEAVI